MVQPIHRYLALGQLSLFAFLGVCLAVIPHFLFDRHEVGFSNYGVRAATVIPFSLAFFLCATFTLLAARLVPRRTPILERFRRALCVLSALLVLVVASTYPYKIDRALTDIHIVVGALLLAFEMTLSLWLTIVLPTSWRTLLALTVQVSGCVVALATLAGAFQVLLLAQLIASAGFGGVLVSAVPRLIRPHPYEPTVILHWGSAAPVVDRTD